MSNIPRNSLCPCGSGKKYKRCCINKRTDPGNVLEAIFERDRLKQEAAELDSFQFLREFNPSLVLKCLAILQLIPENHGKYIRLENAVTYTIRNLAQFGSGEDLGKLMAGIRNHFKKNFAEDPPEEFFTENIITDEGSFIVFPGISQDGTEIVQGLVKVISTENKLTEEFVNEVSAGVRLILSLHHTIALAHEYTFRLFPAELTDELSIPELATTKERLALFSFSYSAINSLCKDLNISADVFEEFVYPWAEKGLHADSTDQNLLFQQPFILLDNEYILVLPSTELICLNDFIINKAKKHGLLRQLSVAYNAYGLDQMNHYFARMHWSFTEYTFSPKQDDERHVYSEALLRIDSNKLVYLCFLTSDIPVAEEYGGTEVTNKQINSRLKQELTKLNIALPGYEVLLLLINHSIRVLSFAVLHIDIALPATYRLILMIYEFQLIAAIWNPDRLSLWKYARSFELASQQVRFIPFNKHYTFYEWYVHNEESFFHPDQQPLNFAFFDFAEQGNLKREGVKKIDKLGIPVRKRGKLVYELCFRREEHFPFYISQLVNQGVLSQCYFKYSCPVWFTQAIEDQQRAEAYINAIAYWLHELFPYIRDFMQSLGNDPVLFILRPDHALDNPGELSSHEGKELSFRYHIEPSTRTITVSIPVQIVQYTSSPKNTGERYLMAFLLDLLGQLRQMLRLGPVFSSNELQYFLEKAIPHGTQKMIVMATGYRNPAIAETDLIETRIIPKSDISFTLQNQLKWLNYAEKIDEAVKSRSGQEALLKSLARMYFDRLVREIMLYEGDSLLYYFLHRNETFVHEKAVRRLRYPVKLAGYSKYMNVLKEFGESERDINYSSMAIRGLVEYIICLKPSGNKIINDDSADLLLAYTGQLITYSSMSDEIHYNIREYQMSLLPSGRLGIDRSAQKEQFELFTGQIFEKEMNGFIEGFPYVLRKPAGVRPPKTDKEKSMVAINDTFKEEWGIGLYDLLTISFHISEHILESGKSVIEVTGRNLKDLISVETRFSESETDSFLACLTFIPRRHITDFPADYRKEDVYIWRYNRRLSFLSRPIVRTWSEYKDSYLISARHLWMAAEHLVSQFHDGTLKTSKQFSKIQALTGAQGKIKGDKFRNEVFEWLNKHTNLRVISNEVKIRKNEKLNSESDFGDIDVLAIDGKNHIIYSIECKNTDQSKSAYAFRQEINDYLGLDNGKNLIQKHVRRDQWLKENLEIVKERFKLEEEYRVFSLVISLHILPTQFLAKSPMPILSFFELKKKGLPLIS